MENIIKDLKTNEEKINKIVFSDSKSEIKKIIVRKIDLKGKTKWQIERFVGAQVFHENVDFVGVLSLNFNDYKQIMLEKEGETSVYSKTKNGFKVKSNKNNVITNVSTHNKEKNIL